jgi:hypothetical protein
VEAEDKEPTSAAGSMADEEMRVRASQSRRLTAERPREEVVEAVPWEKEHGSVKTIVDIGRMEEVGEREEDKIAWHAGCIDMVNRKSSNLNRMSFTSQN